MLKKFILICMVCLLAVTITGCSSDDKEPNKDADTSSTSNKTREFTEAKGIIKYITIDGEKIALPETVGEYVSYLEKIGEVELGDTNGSIKDAPKMEANGIASLASYLRVYTSGDDYQWFGIHYFNSTDKKIEVANATVDRIILSYDIYADEEMLEYRQIKTTTVVTADGEITIDGKTTSSDIIELLGVPMQNTDGYLRYEDEAGYTYKFATENQKGILTQIQIDYPSK